MCFNSIDMFFNQVFKQFPPASSQIYVPFAPESRQSLLNSVRTELLEFGDFKRMSLETLVQLIKPAAEFYSSFLPATSAALSSYLPTCTTACCAVVSIRVSFFPFSVIFDLFHRQWRCLFSHSQLFFCRKCSRFLHIVEILLLNSAAADFFFYFSVTDFRALLELPQKTLR